MKDKLYFYRIISIDRIVDGDTFVCTIDLGFHLFKKITVRILDYDAFESRHGTKCRKQAREFNLTEDQVITLGERLKDVLFETLSDGELYLHSNQLDAFGRTLGTVYKNGISILSILEHAKKAFLLEITENEQNSK